MLALSSDIAYIHEPFNLDCRPGICNAGFDHWFQYISDENEHDYAVALENCLKFRYNVSDEFRAAGSLRDLVRMLRDYVRFETYRIWKRRPLVKDPIAVFSAEWLAKQFNMDVIVLIRHPAAFVSSLKKANWTMTFKPFVQQPSLMQNHLPKYKSELDEFLESERDIVDQAILVWNLIHHIILSYRENQPEWTFVKHETLSENPVEEFGKLYDKLGLAYPARIQRKIASFSVAGSAKGRSAHLKRDSKSNTWAWKTRLTDEEIRRVQVKTRDIANVFYAEEDWTQ